MDIMRNAQLAGKVLTVLDTVNVPRPVIRSTTNLADVLNSYAGYFLVLDSQDKLLFSSALTRQLSQDDQTSLLKTALELTPETGAIVPLRGDSLRLFLIAHKDTISDTRIARVAAALPETAAQLPTTLLVGTIIALTPLILLVSVIAAYFVAGRAFKPVDQLINEVEAITDGRSLHRRLPADSSSDELSRLGVTVNAML